MAATVHVLKKVWFHRKQSATRFVPAEMRTHEATIGLVSALRCFHATSFKTLHFVLIEETNMAPYAAV